MLESGDEVGQIGGGELPLERSRCLVVACLESGETVDDNVYIVEVVKGQHFPGDDREEDLHLV